MKFYKIDPREFPIEQGESWFVVHPNNAYAEFRLPNGAISLCLESFMDVFQAGTVYRLTSHDSNNGWITVESTDTETLFCMPEYLFSRHFDAESFVRNLTVRPRVVEDTFRD